MNQQRDIFQSLGAVGLTPAAFPELCTALYERELQALAHTQQMASLAGLQRRLASTSYYVKQAARGMLQRPTPFSLDIQNASWQAQQKRHCKLPTAAAEKLQRWLQGEVKLGTVVAVFDQHPQLQRVLLDSIDRIDRVQQRVHLNMYGWFDWQGQPLEAAPYYRLVKPDLASLTPALCGHQWNHRGITTPRTLSLREVLLATTLQWRG